MVFYYLIHSITVDNYIKSYIKRHKVINKMQNVASYIMTFRSPFRIAIKVTRTTKIISPGFVSNVWFDNLSINWIIVRHYLISSIYFILFVITEIIETSIENQICILLLHTKRLKKSYVASKILIDHAYLEIYNINI